MTLKKLLLVLAAILFPAALYADNARFDLAGPKIDVRVTRGTVTLPIAQVPNLQPGDKLFVKADLPSTQSNHLLLVVAFLRGTTNEPPDDWFTEIETWNKKTLEGTTITVPAGAEEAIMFVAPETGGDFKTLRSAVKGKPGLFIRADADLNEASFEQQRIEAYLAGMKTVNAADPKAIADRSAKLAATLALKPNADCFKQPVDSQVTCLTQSSAPVLLADGHGQSIAEALSSGASSDFINAAAVTPTVAGGAYSTYVGAVVDLVHLVSLLRTAQFQYIPAISFPLDATLNLKLNAPPSFINPKTVMVIGLPAIQKPKLPPLRAHDPNLTACLLQPKMPLLIEGAPLVFSTSFAHGLVLHLNRTGDQTDLPLTPDAFAGGLVVTPEPARKLLDTAATPPSAAKANVKIGKPTDLTITGTIRGYWGFDFFTGPTLTLQQIDGKDWKITSKTQPMAGQDNHLILVADGTACVEHVALASTNGKDADVAFHPATAADKAAAEKPADKPADKPAPPTPDAKPDARPAAKPAPDAKPAAKRDPDAKPEPDAKPAPAPAPVIPNTLALDVPLKSIEPGGYSLSVKQYGDKDEIKVPLTAYDAAIHLDDLKIHAGDKATDLTGKGLKDVVSVEIAGRTFTPAGDSEDTRVHLESKEPVTPKEGSEAKVKLKDGRILPVKIAVAAARPTLKLLSFKATPAQSSGDLPITLGAKDDIPLDGKLTFVVTTKDVFPRTQTVEVATADASVYSSLSLAASNLILQDDHTAIATLDPLKAFGASAFGKLQMRPVAADGTPGDWTALGTLVRTPRITAVNCTTTAAPTCTATGSNFFLVQSFSAARDSKLVDVPTGEADSTFAVPTPADGATLFLKLRDDPSAIATLTLPTPVTPASASPTAAAAPPAATAAPPPATAAPPPATAAPTTATAAPTTAPAPPTTAPAPPTTAPAPPTNVKPALTAPAPASSATAASAKPAATDATASTPPPTTESTPKQP